ncbi:unnamed protein product [Staurois parvus]|uniref:Uncharacterized protein n=1 Tax=Staurois parvus TaxID=386267 RepID=A0ABN9FZ20_9NEOB|nr:unnamed protein product [Staurois parvus]
MKYLRLCENPSKKSIYITWEQCGHQGQTDKSWGPLGNRGSWGPCVLVQTQKSL